MNMMNRPNATNTLEESKREAQAIDNVIKATTELSLLIRHRDRLFSTKLGAVAEHADTLRTPEMIEYRARKMGVWRQ
jgi:hypothetical protein